MCMYSGVFKILQRGRHGKHAEREPEPITGVWGRFPSEVKGGPRAEPLVAGSGGLEAENFAFECSMKTANLPIFWQKMHLFI